MLYATAQVEGEGTRNKTGKWQPGKLENGRETSIQATYYTQLGSHFLRSNHPAWRKAP